MKEFILCAANYYNDADVHDKQPVNIEVGFVICGRRHYNCNYTFEFTTFYWPSELRNAVRYTAVQGFLTNTNRFVDRKEAYKIAFGADQIIGPNKGCPTNDIGLTSEDLY